MNPKAATNMQAYRLLQWLDVLQPVMLYYLTHEQPVLPHLLLQSFFAFSVSNYFPLSNLCIKGMRDQPQTIQLQQPLFS